MLVLWDPSRLEDPNSFFQMATILFITESCSSSKSGLKKCTRYYCPKVLYITDFFCWTAFRDTVWFPFEKWVWATCGKGEEPTITHLIDLVKSGNLNYCLKRNCFSIDLFRVAGRLNTKIGPMLSSPYAENQQSGTFLNTVNFAVHDFEVKNGCLPKKW